MDLSQYCTKESSEEGSWLDILDFDFETPIGAKILVLGPDSREAVRMSDEEEREAQKKLAEMFAGAKKKGASEPESESSEEKSVRKAVKLTKGWQDIALGDKVFEYNEKNAKWLYENSPHIRNQVLGFYQRRANFTKAGSDSSKKPSETKSGSTTRAKGA